MWPWLDAAGRLSPFRTIVLLALVAPGALVALDFTFGNLGAQPVEAALHAAGLWTIRLLFVALAVTPLRLALDWPRLLDVRRMIGVAAFAYGFAHIVLYAADESFDLVKVASEIALRIYLTIGFVALLGLAALAATSTDAAVRRMGSRWRQLHRAAYAIGLLAAAHFFMQSKANLAEPMLMMGLFVWLMGYRWLAKRWGRGGRLGWPWIAGLGTAAVALTAMGEAAWFWFRLGADPLRVLAVNLSLDTGFRPAWGVAFFAVLVLAGHLLRRVLKSRARARGAPLSGSADEARRAA